MKNKEKNPAARYGSDAGLSLTRGGNSSPAHHEAMVIIQDSDEFMKDLLSAIDSRLEGKVGNRVAVEDEILDAQQTCELLHISPKQFQNLRKQNRIKFSQVGRKIYVKRSDIDRYIESHSNNAL